MKTIYQYIGMVMLLLTTTLAGCEGEKDMVIIDELLPIKTSTFYMVGDATPAGWDINNPTPFTASDEDPLIFVYEGAFNKGEMKCCIKAGSWDNAFIRPMEGGTEINQSGIAETTFDMHAGDPDNKWVITYAAIYRFTFNLRAWTIRVDYVGEIPEAPKTPIETETLYLIGGATPGGWDQSAATPLVKDADNKYLFSCEVSLKADETFKAFMVMDDSWSQDFMHPVEENCTISKDGISDSNFKCYKGGADTQWKVVDAGKYRITMDLKEYTIKAEYLGEYEEPQPADPENPTDQQPIETNTLFVLGDATPNGWDQGGALSFTVDADNQYLFTCKAALKAGTFKAFMVMDDSWGQDFLHPLTDNCQLTKDGVADSNFKCYKGGDDFKWQVVDEGTYLITFDLEHYTIKAQYLTPIETSVLYILGDATPYGWSLASCVSLLQDAENKFLFSTTVDLVAGEMKACLLNEDGNWDQPFIHPSMADCAIGKEGVANPDFNFYAGGDDYKWKVTEAGKYKLVFDLQNYTFTATVAE